MAVTRQDIADLLVDQFAEVFTREGGNSITGTVYVTDTDLLDYEDGSSDIVISLSSKQQFRIIVQNYP